MEKYRVEHNNTERDINFRPESISDAIVIRQIFNEKCFDFSSLSQAKTLADFYMKQLKQGLKPVIIDAGANIGAASIWFTLAYPEAKIISIEPEHNNACVLKENASKTNIEIIEGAIGCEPGNMFLVDPGIGEWGYRIIDIGRDPIIMISGNEIMNEISYLDHFSFVCKIDIEGGEDNLFLKNTDWLKAFALIIIELHDWMLPGEANSKNFFKFITEGNYDLIYRGELIFAFNNDLIV